MNIYLEKLGLIQWITELNDSTIIEKLKKFRAENSLSTDWWDEISTEAKESIEKGLNDIREGSVHSLQSVRKTYEKYL